MTSPLPREITDELVEAAYNAIDPADRPFPINLRAVRAVIVAAFQATIPCPLPTDEDREALFKALAGIVEEGIDHRDAVDAILAAGFRRSVVSTPSEDVRALIEESLTRNHVGERVSAQPEAYRQRIAEVISDRLSAVSAPPTITDEMAEGMARMLHAQSAEGRSGFSWPVSGEWGRQRDLEAARIVLNYVFTFVSKCAGCHATVTTVNPDPRHEDGCVVAARAALGGEGGTQ